MLVRLVESLFFYLRLSIVETFTILRMTDGHPYDRIDLLYLLMIYKKEE